MLRSGPVLLRSLRSRGLCCPPTSTENIVASVVFERSPLVVPKIDPAVYAFQQFSFRWGKMVEKNKKKKKEEEKPEQILEIPESMRNGDYEIEFKRVPWSGKADENNNKRSPMRALDKRLYLLLYGHPHGTSPDKCVWHFPEKIYESEATLRKCAELALETSIGDLSHANFIGTIPIGHLTVQTESDSGTQPFKRFFFKSQVLGLNKFSVSNCEDFAWATKDEIMEYFPERADFFRKMIIG